MHNLFWPLLILFLIASYLRQDWIYYLVYIVGGVWVFSHWWIGRGFRKLDVQRDMLTHAFVGEKLGVRVRLVNRSWLPLPWVTIDERVPVDLKETDSYRTALSIGGKSRLDHTYMLQCKRRGYFPVGPLTLTTGDLFGFAESSWQEHGTTYVTVYPEVLPLEQLGLPSRSPFGSLAARQRLFEDPNRMTGVRPYMTGDTLRRIHWKASAHEDALLVKKFQPAISLNVAIVLDLNREAYPLAGAIGISEWAIVVASSSASYVVGRRQPVGLITNGLDSVTGELTRTVPTRQGQGQLMAVLTTLARVQMHNFDTDLAHWLPRQIAGLEWGTTLVVVTPQIDEPTLWTLHAAYRRGFNVVGLVCAAQPNFDSLRGQGAKLGVHLHHTIWERDLHRVA